VNASTADQCINWPTYSINVAGQVELTYCDVFFVLFCLYKAGKITHAWLHQTCKLQLWSETSETSLSTFMRFIVFFRTTSTWHFT